MTTGVSGAATYAIRLPSGEIVDHYDASYSLHRSYTCASGGSGSGSSSGAKLGPRLAVDRERIDFGRVPLNKSVRAEFKVSNNGDRPLTLDTTAPVQAIQGC